MEKKLKKILSRYSSFIYLNGPPGKVLEKEPKNTSLSGFYVFLVNDSGQEKILKILWNNKFYSRLQNEKFVYQTIAKINNLKDYLPRCYQFSTKDNFFEIEFLKNYQNLGLVHQISNLPSINLLVKILETISYFHINKKRLEIKKNILPARDYHFYLKKLFNLDTGHRIKIFFSEETEKKIKQFLTEKKEMFIKKSDCFLLGDRNPSNIFVKNSQIKLVDFDRIGIGNPALEYSFLYLTLLPYPNHLKTLISFLKKRYDQQKEFWFHFLFDIMFRSIDEIYFWEKKDKKIVFLLKNNFLKIFDYLINKNGHQESYFFNSFS